MGPELYNKMRPYLGDEGALMERMAGHLDLWEECVLLFPRDELLQEMGAAVVQKDYVALYEMVHRLKGNLANFGFDASADVAVKLLVAIKAEDVPGIEHRYSELAMMYKEIIERIGETE